MDYWVMIWVMGIREYYSHGVVMIDVTVISVATELEAN